jgi:hypothetical protein
MCLQNFSQQSQLSDTTPRISGLVVKSVVAIDGPRVRFTADATSIIAYLHASKTLREGSDACGYATIFCFFR